MSKYANKPETQARAAATVRLVNRFNELAVQDPAGAIREADFVESPSARMSVLIAIAKRTRDVGPLADARDILNGTELPYTTRNKKVANITFAAVGIDNTFAAETTEQAPGPKLRAELCQQLSLAVVGSMKRIIRAGDPDEFNRYPDFVMAAFHESVGDPTYFKEDRGYTMVARAPRYLVDAARTHPLDPATDGAVALEAFRDNPPYFTAMSQFIEEHAPA